MEFICFFLNKPFSKLVFSLEPTVSQNEKKHSFSSHHSSLVQSFELKLFELLVETFVFKKKNHII